ncbi:MAG: HEPN domain-containing protein [Acidobacteriota bacterium]
MANRALDWLAQAAHDLEHAEHSLEDGDYDWACFAAHQAAEKAVKGLYLRLGGEAWGHSVTRLLKDLGARLSMPRQLEQAAKSLDKHYIPTRYPNGFDSGAPFDYYVAEEAEKALAHAKRIYEFCHQSIH